MQTTYDTDSKNKYRYTLGTQSDRCLYVIGVNPSTASNLKLDPTLKNVEAFVNILGFDSFMMLNLYPQRATLPQNLHKRKNTEHFNLNIQMIEKYAHSNPTIWAAWGDLITIRPYLAEALAEIKKIFEPLNPRWIQYDDHTKKGHPRHPSRKKHENRFRAFNIEKYLNELFQ